MSLRLKRNLPTLLLLFGILASLAFFLGSQPVIAYTLNAVDPGTAGSATSSSLSSGDLVSLAGPSTKEVTSELQALPASGGFFNPYLSLAVQ